MKRFLLSLCFLFSFGVSAAEWKDGGGWKAAPVSTGADGVYQVLPDMRSPNNNHVTVCTPSSCARTGDLPAPSGRGNPRISPSASFTKGAIAAGAVSLAGKVLPWLSVGMGLYDWYKEAGLGVDEVSGDLGDMVGYTSSKTVSWQPSDFDAQAKFVDARSACEGQAKGMQASRSQTYSNYVTSLSSVVLNGSTANCVIGFTYKTSGGNVVTGSENHSVRQVAAVNWCADIYGRAVVAPIGGLCPGGVFQPISSAAAISRLNSAPVSSDVLKRSLGDVLKAGGSIEDTGQHSVSGPSSVSGETKIKTSVSASGVTQVTTIVSTYNYNYSGDTFTITKTEVAQNPDGSTDSVTSDTPDPLCSENPDSLACAKLGDIPTDSPQWETKTISYQADSLGLPAACPAPWSAQLRGWTLSFSYQPACEIAPQIRLAVLALSSLGALLMIITTVRT